MLDESSQSTGPTSGDGTTCEPFRRIWPTPNASVANLGESVESWDARRARVKLTARNGNGMGAQLTIEAQRCPTGPLTSSLAVSPARTSASPGRARGYTLENEADSSSSSSESFARWSQDSFFLRTSQRLSAAKPGLDTCQTDAYAAGLIDGEGCISLSRYQNKSGFTYSARVEVGMALKGSAVLIWLASTYGGTIRRTRNSSERWMAADCWGLFGAKAVPFLERILPYLKLKRNQAEMAIAVQLLANDGWTEENRRRGSALFESIRKLNAKGPEQESESCSLARLAGGTWVTAQRDLFSGHGWETFSGRWPRSGMTRNGSAYRLPPLAPRISGIGSSSWPTPSAAKAGNDVSLTCSGDGRANPNKLGWAVAAYPAPTARDWRSGSASDATHARNSRPLNEQIARQEASGDPTRPMSLNPAWVEWLMGFPIGWTDCEDSETP